MSRIAKIISIFICSLIANSTCAQYFQYSQYNFTEQRINPAMTGVSRYASVSLDIRNQKTAADFPITSTFLELSYPFLNSSTGLPWSGIGISLHADKAGSIYQRQEIGLSYGIHLRVARNQSLSIGAKFLHQATGISMDGLYTGAQYLPDRGFDALGNSGENLSSYRNNVNTFSAGLYWQGTDNAGKVLNHLGVSFFDINRPPDSFFGDNSQLSSTLVVNAGFQVYSKNAFHLFPEALFTYSAASLVTSAGLRMQREMKTKLKQTPDRIELLTKYSSSQSAILGMQFHKENLSVGLSYDFPVGSYVSNLGALEVGVTLRRLVSTRAQKTIAKRKKAAEEKKLLNAKKKVNVKKVTPVVAQKTEALTDTVSINIPVNGNSNGKDTVDVGKAKVDALAEAGRLKQDPLAVEKVTLNFAFQYNSIDLDDSSEDFLDQLAISLKDDELIKVSIVGYTDNIGSEKFNLRLSQKRADVVKHYLIRRGVDSDRLISNGKGMSNQLNDNQTEADRALNRRVELILHH